MKRFRVLTAALCAAVLLCGFSVPAYAYAGGEGEDYGDPTMETSAPEPTITPGEGFDQEGNLVTRDLLYDEHTNKQFITVQTSGGNTFYIVIDYDKPVDEEGEQYETYFFSVVDEGVRRRPRPPAPPAKHRPARRPAAAGRLQNWTSPVQRLHRRCPGSSHRWGCSSAPRSG